MPDLQLTAETTRRRLDLLLKAFAYLIGQKNKSPVVRMLLPQIQAYVGSQIATFSQRDLIRFPAFLQQTAKDASDLDLTDEEFLNRVGQFLTGPDPEALGPGAPALAPADQTEAESR